MQKTHIKRFKQCVKLIIKLSNSCNTSLNHIHMLNFQNKCGLSYSFIDVFASSPSAVSSQFLYIFPSYSSRHVTTLLWQQLYWRFSV